MMHYTPDPRALDLPPTFYDLVHPATFPAHILRFRNQPAAATVGLDHLDDSAWVQSFSHFTPLHDNIPQPLAFRYHGHQFLSYNPNLGDGRGFLFAQMRDTHGRLLDLGTKGSGKTPWSRGGDGRLTLKGGVREILATELLEALGVSTSRTFSVIETGESLQRHDEPSPTRSCVLVRLSHSHIRFGTFQRFATLRDAESLETLVDYCLEHLYPKDLQDLQATQPHPTRSVRVTRLFTRVVERTARVCAQWMVAGFVHGVLNTDNMSVTGESFDYGPYRFTPTYNPNFVAAYFDHSGVYAFGRQPQACLWNLTRLAEALSLIGDRNSLDEALRMYDAHFKREHCAMFLRRLGVQPRSPEEDDALVQRCVHFLTSSRVPIDHFFWDWRGGWSRRAFAAESRSAHMYDGESFGRLRRALRAYEPVDTGDVRVAGSEPESLWIDEIEEIWDAIDRDDDWSLLSDKVERIRAYGEVLGVRFRP